MELTLTLTEQRKDIDKAILFLDHKIGLLSNERNVLIDALNSIDDNQEDILESSNILARVTRKIMQNINYND